MCLQSRSTGGLIADADTTKKKKSLLEHVNPSHVADVLDIPPNTPINRISAREAADRELVTHLSRLGRGHADACDREAQHAGELVGSG